MDVRQVLILRQSCFFNGVNLFWPWLRPECLCTVCPTPSRTVTCIKTIPVLLLWSTPSNESNTV